MNVAATTGPSTGFFAVLVAFIVGGGFTLLWQVFLRWRRGAVEDQELVSRISNQVVEGAHGLLEEYRIEVEVAKREVKRAQDQIADLNRLLGSAQARINRLETELEHSDADRHAVRAELAEAIKRREELLRELQQLRGKVSRLERDYGRPPRDDDDDDGPLSSRLESESRR